MDGVTVKREFTAWDVSAVTLARGSDGKLSLSGLSEDHLWALLSGLGRSVDDSDCQNRTDDLALMDHLDKMRREIGA